MLGWVEYHSAGAREPPTRVLEGARFRVVYVLHGEGLRARLSARAAARMLRRDGVRCALLPPAYPWGAIFAARGILPPPLTPLYHATAAALVRRYMAQRGMDARDATLAFAAREPSPELRRAVWELSADVRHIVLRFPGAEEAARALRRQMGLAARVAAAGEAVGASLTVCFDPLEAAGETLTLCEGALSAEYDSAYPNELLAALLLAGALDAPWLEARRVEQKNT